MNYEHDIFISYRHNCPTTKWMTGTFLPELKNRLTPQRPEGINIFSDVQIRIASTWPMLLSKKVATSRLLLPMLTPYYFGSEWCRRELSLMMEREEKLGLRSIERSELGLVVPIRLWDGDKFPEKVKSVQLGNFRDYTDVRRGTKKWYEFQLAMDVLATAIDEILDNNIPDFDDSWLSLTGENIEPLLRIPSPHQTTLLRLTASNTELPITNTPSATRTDTI